ncbi:hypothetical protein [Paracoccus benzoatiresistens]|uniref:Uncharacterized protein n=1 Tax=Paracoccus benzoatiresistens TaxID=2997341 RepID=A0ABT4J8S3_9RHOB|nr:hypothetical protein [Paracoccus sp. EF6]MCZ0963493.1 hypothetical protein [Paracoccus sp. EF6]
MGEHVRRTMGKDDLSKTDAEIVQAMLPGAYVTPLAVAFDQVQKDVTEARVNVTDSFSRRQVQIDGVRATRRFPFTGQVELFDMQPSQWSSAHPRGEVRSGYVTIGIEGRADDRDSLKRELDRQETCLKNYVEWSTAQIDEHNTKLKGLLTEAVARRRNHLSSLDDLADGI